DTRRAVAALVDAVLASGRNFVVIYPNNDEGCELIFDAYSRFDGSARFKLIPSMRVEYFLTLLRSADFLLGNSSAGIRECPVFGVPAINVSSRQAGRGRAAGIIDVVGTSAAIADAFQKADTLRGELAPELHFGAGNSAELFVAALESEALWQVSTQKQFMDMN
ncbi:MAG: UDP-N-acetylglucosamine 2-epimerase, partial [Methyloversatilis sp.]|nr:UDP-N-acetylglucosamine 2-epimerase [Methyloversatilis sp.]